ncbi:MAG: hypothetical protein HQ523_01395 [Lentisphaerae bacterium]|nr:hypothetical protein [Lentisphaerota bacterium]
MDRYEKGFPALLDGFDLETLERDPHSIFALSPDLWLIYLNPAWFVFAKENSGNPGISERFAIGTPVLSAISATLRPFYSSAYRETLLTGTVWHHDYECSSPERFRLYHQTAYPLHNRQGILVINSLTEEGAQSAETRPVHKPDREKYMGQNGLITQCANCRRVQRLSPETLWDWVPDWVRRMPMNTTGGLCPICYDFYWKHRSKSQ